MYREMMDVSPPPVMTRQHRADKSRVGVCDKAHARISLKKRPDVVSRIRAAEPDTRALFPEGKDLVVPVDLESRY